MAREKSGIEHAEERRAFIEEQEQSGELLAMTMIKGIYHCKVCGSPDVEIAAWVHCNSDQVTGLGSEGPADRQWCPDCEDDKCRIEWLDDGIEDLARQWCDAFHNRA